MMNEKIKKIDSNTGSNSIRNIRGERQYRFEKELPQLFGSSIVERFFAIRDALFFDMNSPTGLKLDVLISNRPPASYPDRELVAEKYLPIFYKFTDELHEEIERETNQDLRAEKGFRLATLVYIINILIHQSIDGNGQTSKLLALSYIHEFDPDLRNNFIPIKYDQGRDEDSQYDRADDLQIFSFNTEPKLPPNISEADIKLFATIKELREIQFNSSENKTDQKLKSDDLETYKKIMTQRYMQVIQKAESTSDISFSEKITQNHSENDYINLGLKVRKEVSSLLNKKYPGFHFSIYDDGEPYKETFTEREFILSPLLVGDRGLELLEAYVTRGSTIAKENLLESDSVFLDLDRQIIDTLVEIEDDFKKVLQEETSEVHNQKFEKFENNPNNFTN